MKNSNDTIYVKQLVRDYFMVIYRL